MKALVKVLFGLAVICSALSLTSCRETKEENAADKVEAVATDVANELDEAADKVEGAVEETVEKVEEAVEDAAE